VRITERIWVGGDGKGVCTWTQKRRDRPDDDDINSKRFGCFLPTPSHDPLPRTTTNPAAIDRLAARLVATAVILNNDHQQWTRCLSSPTFSARCYFLARIIFKSFYVVSVYTLYIYICTTTKVPIRTHARRRVLVFVSVYCDGDGRGDGCGRRSRYFLSLSTAVVSHYRYRTYNRVCAII